MGRTAGVWQQDTPFTDGQVFLPATAGSVASGTATYTRSGKGLLGLSIGNSQTMVLDFVLDKLIFRTGLQDDAQEQFGLANGSGAQLLKAPPNTFSTPYGVSGRPPFAAGTNLVPPTKRPKGISITSVTPIYSVAGAALTTATIGISETKFVNVVAPVVSDVLANAAHGLPTATNAQPYAPVVAVNATPSFLIDLLAEYIIELDLTTAGGGTAFLYGLFLQLAYNLN